MESILIYYTNDKGINDLIVAKYKNIIATSKKNKAQAIASLKRKINKKN